MIAQTVRDFAEKELMPVASRVDREHWFPSEQVKKLGELGMMGVAIPTDFDGAGMDTISYAIAMEEVLSHLTAQPAP